jgi:hypothetical protein
VIWHEYDLWVSNTGVCDLHIICFMCIIDMLSMHSGYALYASKCVSDDQIHEYMDSVCGCMGGLHVWVTCGVDLCVVYGLYTC